MKYKRIHVELPSLEFNPVPTYVNTFINDLFAFVYSVAGDNPEYCTYREDRSKYIHGFMYDIQTYRDITTHDHTLDAEWFVRNYRDIALPEHGESYHTMRLICKIVRYGVVAAHYRGQFTSLLLLLPRRVYTIFYDFKFMRYPTSVFIEMQNSAPARDRLLQKVFHWLWLWRHVNMRLITWDIWVYIAKKCLDR